MRDLKFVNLIAAMMLVICGFALLVLAEDLHRVCYSLCIMIVGLSLWIVSYHLEYILMHIFALAFVVIVIMRDIIASICYGYTKVRRIRQRSGSYARIYAKRCNMFEKNIYRCRGRYERR